MYTSVEYNLEMRHMCNIRMSMLPIEQPVGFPSDRQPFRFISTTPQNFYGTVNNLGGGLLKFRSPISP